MKRNVATLRHTDPWVCAKCGVCASVCPTGAITVTDAGGAIAWPTVNQDACVDCGLCLGVCPGLRVVHDDGRPVPLGLTELYGPTRECVLADATDDALRHGSSSGGLVTGLLQSLLRAGHISGAVVTTIDLSGPRSRTFLARCESDICAAKGSKYMPSSMAAGMRQIADEAEGRFAVVGLPCQIAAVREAARKVPAFADKIALCVGLFCGGTKDLRYTSLLLRLMEMKASQAAEFAFRGDGWPGRPHATDLEGRIRYLDPENPLIGRVWTRAAFTPARCLLCDDPLAAAADIAVGDPWNLDYADDPVGHSLAVIRTEVGRDAVERAEAVGGIAVQRRIPETDIIESQRALLWRRHRATARIRLASCWSSPWRRVLGDLPPADMRSLLRATAAFAQARWESSALGVTRMLPR